MQKWYNIFPKNTGLSIYVWIIFCLLPFYFIFRTTTAFEIIFGIVMIILFFTAYRLSFISKGKLVYLWVSVEMVISVTMTLFYVYVYFALFLAFFIGNIKSKSGFFTLYVIHLVTTIISICICFFIERENFMSQFPFIVISIIGVILLPFNTYNRNKQEQLESQLEDANNRISKLMVVEERQRIARDLHDTLGQKLSLIGLKSDLARRLVDVQPYKAKEELLDIHQTARTALKEVREMVSNMRGIKLEEEMERVQQLLSAAEIKFSLKGEMNLHYTTLLVENVMSMCIKEAVTNVVKHSQATFCEISIQETAEELSIRICDNGVGIQLDKESEGHGLKGIKERLEFVNGSLQVTNEAGTTLAIRVPQIIKQETGGIVT